ncbi:MAG: translation elongation factor Ts [Anaerolineae bacterium]|jgi:elongation factor Ts
MAEITAQMVKELREATGAGPLDCKKALQETNGDMQKAVDYLREKGIAKAAKKLGAGRTMNEGVIEVYQHFNKRMGVIVEVNCETDFVANTEAFRTFAREIALHIISNNPQYVKREDVPQSVIDHERAVQTARALEEGKPADKAAMIAEGRMNKFFEEICLMEQGFYKDEKKTIEQLLKETVAEVGESIVIRRFARFQLGEGTENGEE